MTQVRPLPGTGDTQRLGAALARACPWDAHEPRVLFLSGDLGAGKTTLAAALLQTLGVAESVRSPSYALIEVYPLPRGEAVHVDLYRLHDAAELTQLGLRDYLQGQTLVVVEWPERAAAALPEPDLELRLDFTTAGGDTGRRALLQARTPAGIEWLARTSPDSL